MTAVMILATIQAIVGAFDLFFHHETTERLTWKASARQELWLHAARNGLYAVVFLVLAWFEPRGIWAVAFVAVLLVEIIITLTDFVVEDRTRQLPESERILHTILAVSYGAFLALLTPHLIVWFNQTSALIMVERGVWSAVMTLFALGVALWCVRDAVRAHAVSSPARPASPLVNRHLDAPQRVLVTGGTGFIGKRLCHALVEAGHDVTVLTRDPRKARDLPTPIRIATTCSEFGDDTVFDAIVNLAGASVAGGRWTERRKAVLRASRIDTTRDVVALIGRLRTRPEVLVSASAIGFYGTDSDQAITENNRAMPGFAHDMCAEREAEARKASRYGVRVVELRLSLVLGAEGGPLGAMLPAFEFGAGSRIGHGRQWMSWVHLDDAVRATAFLIARKDLRGPFNVTAPQPVTNTVFSARLAATLKRPCLIAIPGPVIRFLLGEMGQELLLASKRVLPQRLSDAGFVFEHATIDAAMIDILRSGEPLKLEPANPQVLPKAA